MERVLATVIKSHLEMALAQLLQAVSLTPQDDPNQGELLYLYQSTHNAYELFCERHDLTWRDLKSSIAISTGTK